MSDLITIPAIDDNGDLYPIEKMAAHRSGVLHMAISIFVFSRGRLLIQRRAADKYHSGGLWANTCCTHPDWQEDLETAAHRRLREELCLEVPSLERRSVIDYKARVSDELWEHERVHVFSFATEEDVAAPAPNPDEVSETRWIDLPTLRSEVAEDADRFAPWFQIYVSRWDELKLTDTEGLPLPAAAADRI